VYCGNNPLSRIDPTGLYVDYGPGGTRTEVHSDKTSTELNGRLDRTERPEPRAKIDAVAVAKGLAKGMLNGVVAPVKGAVSALKHPKATYDKAVRAIESFFADPFGVIAHGASATFDAYMNASPEEQAEMLGGYIPAIEFAVTAGGLVVGEPAPAKGLQPGEFDITNWEGYPAGVPKPEGPFKLISGTDYQAARAAANKANQALHAADPSLSGLQIHEIKPVKFGGSPTDLANKIPLVPQEHTAVTTWWNGLMKAKQ